MNKHKNTPSHYGLIGGSSSPIITSSHITSLFLLILIFCRAYCTRLYFLITNTRPQMIKAMVNMDTTAAVVPWEAADLLSGLWHSSSYWMYPGLQTHFAVFSIHTWLGRGHGFKAVTLQDRMSSVKKNTIRDTSRFISIK